MLATPGHHFSAFTSTHMLPVLLILLVTFDLSTPQTYENTKAIFDDKLSSTVYHTEVRPTGNQSQPLDVLVNMELVSIVGVDDVSQKFLCNAFLALAWHDDRLTWDPALYGGQAKIHPLTKQIWRPRLVLLNTLSKRDIFADDHAPVIVDATGSVFWVPGSVFPTSCSLDMTNYPFDEQTCTIDMISMGLDSRELNFLTFDNKVKLAFYIENGEWELKDATIETSTVNVSSVLVPFVEVTFSLKRRPTFLILNIIMPVVFLSFLNVLVFTIPVDSGEKVSYGITVLLALAVFLSIVSAMLPRSSDKVPHVTIYLCILLVVSVLTVIDSIIIVFLSHLEQDEEKRIKAQDNFQTAIDNVRLMKRSVASLQQDPSLKNSKGYKTEGPLSFANSRLRFHNFGRVAPTLGGNMPGIKRSSTDLGSSPPFDDDVMKWRKTPEVNYREEGGEIPRRNKYKLISKYIDKVSLVVFSLVWLSVTLGFLLPISR